MTSRKMRRPQRLGDKGWTRRRVMGGAVAVMGGIMPGAACAHTGVARVPDHRRPGDRDDNAATIRALATRLPVHFPAGLGLAADGAYLLKAVPLLAGAIIQGDGPATVLRALPDAMAVLVAASGASGETLDGIVLRDLRIEGLVTATGFREHWNLVSLSGVDGVRIQRVQFVGFAGDGLYLGAEYGWPKREPRIIRNVIVRDCLFDGVNNDNRNGISVTGGSDITIEGCKFRRCSRSTMPGPIDFEPDPFSFYRIERVRVLNCDFEDCGGNVGQVCIAIPAVVPPPRDVRISGNSFRGYHGTGGDIVITINREPDAMMASMDCVIEKNIGVGGYSGIQIFSGKGILIRNNHWTRYKSRSLLGYTSASAGVMDVTISDRFDGCGWREGVALAVYKGDGVRLEGNIFTGTGNGGAGSAPLYIGTGRIRRLMLVRNDWRSNPDARGLIIVERGADYAPGTAKVTGNILPAGRILPNL